MYYIIRIKAFEQHKIGVFMKIIVANWKMNGSKSLISEYKAAFKDLKKNKIVVCPPQALMGEFKDFPHSLGAQDCYICDSGAFTGESSPKILKEVGCEYVILGHSERRALFLESDDFIYKKYQAALRNDLIPIICIGERKEEKGRWKEVLASQLSHYKTSDISEKTIFAYEPVWSIGTGCVPLAREIAEVLAFIKDFLKEYGNFATLYGGSVNSTNSDAILSCENVDGFLVGGASLKIEEFKKIVL